MAEGSAAAAGGAVLAAAETAAAAAAAAASCSLECRRSARRRRELSGLRRRGSRIIFALCPSLSWVCFSSSHEIFLWCFSSSSTRRRLKTLDDDLTRSVTVHSSGGVGVGWVSRPCDGVSQSGRNRGSWSRRGYSGDIQVVVAWFSGRILCVDRVCCLVWFTDRPLSHLQARSTTHLHSLTARPGSSSPAELQEEAGVQGREPQGRPPLPAHPAQSPATLRQGPCSLPAPLLPSALTVGQAPSDQQQPSGSVSSDQRQATSEQGSSGAGWATTTRVEPWAPKPSFIIRTGGQAAPPATSSNQHQGTPSLQP